MAWAHTSNWRDTGDNVLENKRGFSAWRGDLHVVVVGTAIRLAG